MRIPTSAVRLVQHRLNDQGFHAGAVDGQMGPQTEAALDAALQRYRGQIASEYVTAVTRGSRRRKLTAFIQLAAQNAGINSGAVDGFWGPQTDYAFDELEHLTQYGERPAPWRDIQQPSTHRDRWPLESETALSDFYGVPGDVPLVQIELPYKLCLSWNLRQQVSRLTCHAQVADSLSKVLTGVLEYYGEDGIRELRLDRFGGCYNHRRKRGGTSWSTHAWGIALDFDPDRNRLKWGRDRAALASADYDHWWQLWEEEGWYSLGRARNIDWMHVQAARTPPA